MNINFIKEKIAYYKLWLTFLVAINAGVIAWTFNNYIKINSIRFFVVYFTILVISYAIIVINQKTRRFIDRIGD